MLKHTNTCDLSSTPPPLLCSAHTKSLLPVCASEAPEGTSAATQAPDGPNRALCSATSNSCATTACADQNACPTSMGPLSQISTSDKFNERGVDCEGLLQSPAAQHAALRRTMEAPASGWGIGPVITQGRAIVRRGLSFTLRREPDVTSIRSVKSESHVPSSSTNLVIADLQPSKESKKPHKDHKPTMSIAKFLSSKDKAELSVSHTPSCQARLTALPKLDRRRQADDANFGFSELQRSLDSSDPLKSLLQMPGIHAEVRLPDTAVTSSPTILNPDTMSLTSADSLATSSSGRTSTRSWGSSVAASTSSHSSSNSSTNSSSENTSTTIRVFAKCLRSDIEYKTVSVGPRTTCGELVASLLSKYRMKHRDPNLFYLTMEVTVRRWSGPPIRSLLVLEEGARPAQLAQCRPLGDARFALQMRKGGVIKVHDTVLMPGSQYKSLLVSHRTRAEEVVQLMLNCCSRTDARDFYALHQVCRYPEYKDIQLHPDDRPLEVKSSWPPDRRDEFVFVLRRNMCAALSLRKLSQKNSIQQPDTPPRISSRSSSTSKSEGPPRRSLSLEKQRPRCHSVPTPPPRSRKNICHFQQSLLDSSLADGGHTNFPAFQGQKSSAVSAAKVISTGSNIAVVSESSNYYDARSNAFPTPVTRFHQSVVTRNTINYNVHFNRPPETNPNNDAVIDCTFATPTMTQISDGWPRPRRSQSASRLPANPRLSVAGTITLDDASVLDARPTSQKTITWIEKTWTTTGCQTVLSCTPKPTEREDIYSKSIREFTPPRERPSRRKQVNFADELQFEESPERKHETSSRVSPPTVPPPPESDLSSQSPSPPPLPAVPPPPLTPPSARVPKRVTLNEEVSMEPPPTPATSPPPLTPEHVRVIKPCIKYPKTHQRSLSAPSSPALRKVTLSTAQFDLNVNRHRRTTEGELLNSDKTSKPNPIPASSTHEESPESGNKPVLEPASESGNHSLKHSAGTCERNCKNCFYI